MKNKILKLVMLVAFLLLAQSLSFADKDTKLTPLKEKETTVIEKQKGSEPKEDVKPKTEIVRPAQAAPKDEQPAQEINPVEAQPIPIISPAAEPTSGFKLEWKVISAAGVKGGSASYKVKGTVAESFAGKGSSASYGLKYGYWGGQVETFMRGDVNGNGSIELGDVVFLITYLYKNGPAPVPLLAGDVNCSGVVELGDVVFLISYLYKGGPPPPC